MSNFTLTSKKSQRLLVTAIAAAVTLLNIGCAAMENRPVPVHDPNFAPVFPDPEAKSVNSIGSIFQPGQGMLLFEDSKAHRIGDLLTIRLAEKTNASKAANTTTAKSTTASLAAPTLFGSTVSHNGRDILSASLSGDNSFSGDGASSQSNSLSGNITVSVSQVLSNGNLVIRGEKLLTLNQGDEFVRISGIVRPADISPDNSVDSTKIANAEIIYGGDGAVASANEMGWAARFFNSGWWPF
ncbi:MAG: flagellar basal body L-ring protein FlgH [Gammaproteobacteria bacterium]|nr:flagellar basal body L-ring protein FlgH [Gammaproteobacteria bacterium]